VTVKKYTSVAIPMFWGSRKSMELSGRQDVETGSEKFKMAAA
jgi:hypothetical protein